MWKFQNLRFLLFASVMEFVTADDQCRTDIYIEGEALRCSVFKRWSVATPHLCDVKCEQEITCQSYNYNRKYQICELNNRTKEARPDNFLSAPAWFYIRRLNGRAPLGSIPELPALSCGEIKASEGKHTISGKYWLDPTWRGKAKLIYCDMVNEDIDECKGNHSCHVNAICTNTKGSYCCTCHPGYTGNGRGCTDINECKGNHSCHANATCMNTKGSYVCTCHPGYTGNGSDCTDINECKRNHSCHVNATCMNTLGSHVCQCHAGYTGNGQNCSDIDECKGNHSCHVNATCTNTNGSYLCECYPGFSGNGQSCTADPCCNYQNLSDANRKRSYVTPIHEPSLCDHLLSEGWYRFVGDAGTKMPTTHVSAYRCGTAFPGWLEGGHPTVEDGEVYKKVCFSDRISGCRDMRKISVKNCGSYFIYKLQQPPSCDSRYCGAD